MIQEERKKEIIEIIIDTLKAKTTIMNVYSDNDGYAEYEGEYIVFDDNILEIGEEEGIYYDLAEEIFNSII